MKQTFNIPEGCSTVIVEQIGNQLITTFEPEKYVPKVGDCVKMKYSDGNVYFCRIYETDGLKDVNSENVFILNSTVKFNAGCFFRYESIEKLTPEQFQSEFEKLGYQYDFETNTASKKRWRAKEGRNYFKFDEYFQTFKMKEDNNYIDDENYNISNYFETEQQAQSAADFLKQQLKRI